MPDKITTYRVFHHDTGGKKGKSDILVWVVGRNQSVYTFGDLSPDRAHHIIDLLRNENPVYIHIGSGLLEVAAEPVGPGDEP